MIEEHTHNNLLVTWVKVLKLSCSSLSHDIMHHFEFHISLTLGSKPYFCVNFTDLHALIKDVGDQHPSCSRRLDGLLSSQNFNSANAGTRQGSRLTSESGSRELDSLSWTCGANLGETAAEFLQAVHQFLGGEHPTGEGTTAIMNTRLLSAWKKARSLRNSTDSQRQDLTKDLLRTPEMPLAQYNDLRAKFLESLMDTVMLEHRDRTNVSLNELPVTC